MRITSVNPWLGLPLGALCQLLVGMSELVAMSSGVSRCVGIFPLTESFYDCEMGQVDMILKIPDFAVVPA